MTATNIRIANNIDINYRVLIMMSIFLVLYRVNKYINGKYNPEKIYEFKIDLDEDTDEEEVADRITERMKNLLESAEDMKNNEDN